MTRPSLLVARHSISPSLPLGVAGKMPLDESVSGGGRDPTEVERPQAWKAE
jgi:hypothetical protein